MLEVTALLLAAVVVAVTAVVVSRRWRLWREIDKLPGEVAIPLLGNMYRVFFIAREDGIAHMDKETKKYWPIHRSWLGPIPEVHISKPEHIEKIMTSSELITKADSYSFLHPWLGDGLLTSTGAKWHSRRKMITPAFHFSILETFVEVFAEKAVVLVNLLKTKADGQSFDIYPYITRCALDIICETAMGTSIDAQHNTESDYVAAVYNIAELTIRRVIRPWLLNDFMFRISPTGKMFYRQLDVLHGFTRKVIQQKKRSRKASKRDKKVAQFDDLGRKRRVAFLDMLLEESEDGKKLTDQDLQEEVDTFMFEGHDTTTVGMSWVLILLGHHQDIQDKVYTEVKDIFHDDPKRVPTMQDLHNMKYLEMVIKESLRLYPSVPFIARRATQDIQIGQKFAILEEKTVLSYILRNFRVETVERLEDLKLIGELVLRPFKGVFLRLTPR